jgi:hypothetical protein
VLWEPVAAGCLVKLLVGQVVRTHGGEHPRDQLSIRRADHDRAGTSEKAGAGRRLE